MGGRRLISKLFNRYVIVFDCGRDHADHVKALKFGQSNTSSSTLFMVARPCLKRVRPAIRIFFAQLSLMVAREKTDEFFARQPLKAILAKYVEMDAEIADMVNTLMGDEDDALEPALAVAGGPAVSP